MCQKPQLPLAASLLWSRRWLPSPWVLYTTALLFVTGKTFVEHGISETLEAELHVK